MKTKKSSSSASPSRHKSYISALRFCATRIRTNSVRTINGDVDVFGEERYLYLKRKKDCVNTHMSHTSTRTRSALSFRAVFFSDYRRRDIVRQANASRKSSYSVSFRSYVYNPFDEIPRRDTFR